MDLRDRYNPDIAARILEASRAGSISGYSSLLGIHIDELGPGTAVCSLPIQDEVRSSVGAVHGGAIASLVDHTLSLSIYPLVEPERWVATVEFKINYLDSAREGGLRAVGRVLSLRKNLGVSAVEVDNDGRLIATAQGTLYVRERR